MAGSADPPPGAEILTRCLVTNRTSNGTPMNDQVPVAPGGACPWCGRREDPPLGDGQQLAETVVALVTAQLAELPRPDLDDVLDGAPVAAVARVSAALVAWIIDRTPGGAEWLRRLALAVAAEGGTE